MYEKRFRVTIAAVESS